MARNHRCNLSFPKVRKDQVIHCIVSTILCYLLGFPVAITVGVLKEAIWDKAIQHLKENNELENVPRDIAKLMKEIDRDIKEEELEYIKDSLAGIILPDINRKAKAGFAEYYKKKLMESQFIENK